MHARKRTGLPSHTCGPQHHVSRDLSRRAVVLAHVSGLQHLKVPQVDGVGWGIAKQGCTQALQAGPRHTPNLLAPAHAVCVKHCLCRHIPRAASALPPAKLPSLGRHSYIT